MLKKKVSVELQRAISKAKKALHEEKNRMFYIIIITYLHKKIK